MYVRNALETAKKTRFESKRHGRGEKGERKAEHVSSGQQTQRRMLLCKTSRNDGTRVEKLENGLKAYFFAVRNLHILWVWNELIYSPSRALVCGAFKSVDAREEKSWFYQKKKKKDSFMLWNVRRMTATTLRREKKREPLQME